MDQIPLLAWIGIAIIVIITLVINISLVAMLRAGKPPHLSGRQPRVSGFVGTAQDLAKLGKIMRDPFAGERGQLNELSRLVQRLDKPEAPGPDHTDGQENTRMEAK
jgi:hypothetical protein